jgi:Holliday junction DNA helicase RuvA
MIGRLTGRVLAQEADGGVVLDVGGVGYELAVPLGTLGRARSDESGRVTLWVHTHVREDALALFGFADETERAAFRALLAVSNVGPKIAVAVLGALPASGRNLGALTAVSGIGKKIAERLLLELRDKLPVLPPPGASTTGRPSTATAHGAPVGDDRLRAALTGMGFRPAEAERAVQAIGDRADAVPFEEILREALGILAR